MPQPLLELAAKYSSIVTFKFLLEHGAKLGRRTLHCAVHYAASIGADPSVPPTNTSWSGFQPSTKYGLERRRMSELLPYLCDVLRQDINAMDIEGEDMPAGFYGTPLCYAVNANGVAIVKWLLRRREKPIVGGPESRGDAEVYARQLDLGEFIEVFEKWRSSGRRESYSPYYAPPLPRTAMSVS